MLFRSLIEKFGGVYYALAAYNAGPDRVVTWRREAPGLDQDEFIDNISFTETQAYVKRILGTAEDYRRLYGTGILDVGSGLVAEAAALQQPAEKQPTAKPAAAAQPSRATRSRRR